MERRIVGFRQDEEGDWVALLDCVHRQHVRHRPPLFPAPWVEDDRARAERIGGTLDCPLCDRCEVPDDVVVVRRTDSWTRDTMPAGLGRDHRIAGGTWGRLVVERGTVRFVAATDPPTDAVVDAGSPQGIPPDVAHAVTPAADARFAVEFLRPPPDAHPEL